MFYDEYNNFSTTDELLSDRQNLRVENLSVSSETDFLRGTILTAGSNGVYSPVSATVPATNSFAVAAEDYTSGTTVISAYTSGNFHTDKLITAGNVEPTDFKELLRRDNIILSNLLD